VTTRDWRPRYLQVAEELRDRITTGELPPGGALPSETVLAQTFGLSRTSVRNAIRTLREWGLVRAEQGRGTYIRVPKSRVRRTTDRYQWEKDQVRRSEEERRQPAVTEQELGLTSDNLEFFAEFEAVEADEQLAALFSAPVGTQLLRRTYHTRSQSDGVPLSLTRSYLLHAEIAANPELLSADREPWPGGTQHQLWTIGVELDRIVDEITARPPHPEEADVLDIEAGVSVLVLRKISYATDGRAVEVSDVILPGDRTELVYTTNLARWTE
jgi:GntR family transcriptional regulator